MSRQDSGNEAQMLQQASNLLQANRDFEALECLRIAAPQTTHKDALVKLAELELDFGHPAAALEVANRVAELEPDDPIGNCLAACSLMAMGDEAKADEFWDKALAIAQPQIQKVQLLRAKTLAQYGEFEKAIECLTTAIEAFPGLVAAYAQLVAIKRINQVDAPLVARMEELLKKPELKNDHKVTLEYALGKSYDNLRQFETAMSHFDAANRIRHDAIAKSGGFHLCGYASKMALRREVFNRQSVDEMSKRGSDSELPIFIVGMIRSGTTLAAQILSSHPQVASAGEVKQWLYVDYRLVDTERRCINEQEIRESARNYLNLLGGYSFGKDRVVDKQPGNLLLAGALHIAFPNARIIYMHRHPVDTAISIWTTQMRTSTIFVHDRGNIVFASREHERLRKHWSEVLPKDRFMEVSYETLITDREHVTRQMVEFCGLPWSDDCLTPERNRNEVITPSLWQIRQQVYETSIGRWKNYEPWLGDFRKLF